MRDKQSKKGGGLMIVHNNNQAYTELEQVDHKARRHFNIEEAHLKA